MSLANYVIICKSKIDVEAAKTTVEKIAAVSRGATDLVCHIQLINGGQLTEEDCKPISDLQHNMMETMHDMTKAEAEEKIKTMFGLLYQLEKKFPPLDVMNSS